MGQYKPTWQQAVEIVRRRCGRRPAVETVGLAQAGGRVLARALRAGTPFPESRLAGMDGVAVMNGVAATQVQTGQTLGADVQCVLMDELGVALGSSVGELPLNSHMSEIGAEYRQGELVASVGQQVSPGLMSQAALLGLTTLSVFVPPLLGVVVVGQGPMAQATLAWLVMSLESRFPCQVKGQVVAGMDAVPLALDGRYRALIVVSDGAPGRYRELRSLHRSPPGWYRSDFWKVNVHPCKHIGFGRVGDIPALVLPDVLYKTAIGAALMTPVMVTALFGLEDVSGSVVSVCDMPSIAGPYPYVVPVSRAASDAAYTALRTDCEFSGRGAVELSGLAWFGGGDEAPKLRPFCWGGRHGRSRG